MGKFFNGVFPLREGEDLNAKPCQLSQIDIEVIEIIEIFSPGILLLTCCHEALGQMSHKALGKMNLLKQVGR